ncbi:MAG: exosortase/archaeosortase family protein [Bacteroidales bacterium]|nr:exosortase/archaeosortase family protein [Bacteroidales bacterium]
MDLLNLNKLYKRKVPANYRPVVDVFLFCLITYGFHELWWWLAPFFKPTKMFQEIATFLTNQVFNSSTWILNHILGWTFQIAEPNTFIFLNPGSSIQYPASLSVNESCSGLKQFFQIAILFILFPGPWKHKLWYIPVSILIIHGVNILRIVILSVILVHQPESWNFAHDWILRPFFYVIIFTEWLVWVHYFKNKT